MLTEASLKKEKETSTSYFMLFAKAYVECHSAMIYYVEVKIEWGIDCWLLFDWQCQINSYTEAQNNAR